MVAEGQTGGHCVRGGGGHDTSSIITLTRCCCCCLQARSDMLSQLEARLHAAEGRSTALVEAMAARFDEVQVRRKSSMFRCFLGGSLLNPR